MRLFPLLLAAALFVPTPTRASEPPVKTLEAVNIEGELRLPQVLFITSRDSDRPLDYLEWYAARTSVELGLETPMLGRLHVITTEVIPTPPVPGTTDTNPEAIEEAPISSKEEQP